jgi:hypothetical protein
MKLTYDHLLADRSLNLILTHLGKGDYLMIRCRLLVIIGILPVILLVARPVQARQATPATGCDVAPRTDAELQALAAAAVATPRAAATLTPAAGTPGGTPVDAATIAELERTLQLTTNCADAGDLKRLLALYTDRFIAEQVFGSQPSPIVRGTPVTTPSYIVQIPPPVGAAPEIEQASLLPDGHIGALVRAGSRTEMISFAHDTQRDLWQIDEIVPVMDFGTPSANPAAQQPAEAQIALADASAHLGVGQDALAIVRIEAKQWPDASLGCPKSGEFYAQVVTPGYLIVIRGGDQDLEYHTDQRGNVVLCHE